MTIRKFDNYLNERNLQSTLPLSALNGVRLGIDGLLWLRKILKFKSNDSSTDLNDLGKIFASIVATGGTVPFNTLNEVITKELDNFKSVELMVNIQPFFVFNGLQVRHVRDQSHKSFLLTDYRESTRESAWLSYEKGDFKSAFELWFKSNSVGVVDYLSVVFKILHDNNVEFMRAPFSQWAQLVYLENHPKQLTHCTYSDTNILVWDGIERCITHIDFEKNTFKFIEKSRVLADLNVSNEQFLDISIMAGFDFIDTFPPIATAFDFRKAVEAGANYLATLHNFLEHPQVMELNYVEMFNRTKTTIRNHLILTEEGRVEPFARDYAPNDLHEIFGFRYPDELFFFLCHGVISPQLMIYLHTGAVFESHPLGKGDSLEYRNFLKSSKLLELRGIAFNLLTWNLHVNIQNQPMVSVNWFEKELNLGIPKPEITGLKWLPSVDHTQLPQPPHVKTPQLSDKNQILPSKTVNWFPDSKKKQKTEIIDIKFVLKTVQLFQRFKTTQPKDPNTLNPSLLREFKFCSTTEELQSLLLLRLLEVLNYSHNSIHLRTFGIALLKGLSLQPVTFNSSATNVTESANFSANNGEELLNVFELLKKGVLNNSKFQKNYEYTESFVKIFANQPAFMQDEKKTYCHLRLIIRVISVLNFQLKAGKLFPGQFDRSLLEFNNFVKVSNRCTRNIFESILISYAVNDQQEILKEYNSQQQQPEENKAFINSTKNILKFNFNSAIINTDTNSFAKQMDHTHYNKSLENKKLGEKGTDLIELSLAKLEDIYQDASSFDVRDQFYRGIHFWKQVLEGVKSLANAAIDGIPKDLTQAFLQAEEWFKDKR
ncbi:hypothetical protein HDU92_000815 [Lobulomyces angularis]|nr:hypothetical protein HDU92_000815 [Lobulomyces angularis]